MPDEHPLSVRDEVHHRNPVQNERHITSGNDWLTMKLGRTGLHYNKILDELGQQAPTQGAAPLAFPLSNSIPPGCHMGVEVCLRIDLPLLDKGFDSENISEGFP